MKYFDSTHSDSLVKTTHLLNGLAIETGDILTHKSDHGRSLSTHKYLYWGEQYFLVWHKNYKIAYPPEIRQRMLAPQDNWECIEIQLPNNPNPNITAWAEQYLKRQIQTPAITLSLVTPPI